ncbi:LysR substrate-binding domain-containing protein [Shinella zoogloeoides]|uniref:LysR substrate-binding domain-containing protein n=1 Tax=Shinella zoogloeoides TaxID=352475 RepID=UPI00273DD05E|nr:LysR substrate-binding domain-containing protein [Shinella zoogloeoides]WLR95212.1 LysR substrate-binding domain-containing protein [Shinella zoogloeoides]
MASRLPPLNPLRAFEATVRRGSVSAAARELNVTHGAVSHQIRALEEALDTPLFERGGKRLKLTPQGALLLPAVTNAFGEIAAATALMKQPETRGEITVTCVPALLSLWLIPRLDTFTDHYPGVRVTLIASNDPEHLRSLDTDVCILYGDGSWPDCWTRLWSHLRLFPVASPSLLNSRPLRSVRDLADHTLFHGDDGREWNTWLSAADAVEMGRGRQHFMSDARLSTEAALHGQGIALGDTITASNLIARGDLVVPFDLSVPANHAFHVACRHTARQTPIVKVFIDWLFAALEETLPEPQASARTLLRGRGRAAEPIRPIPAPAPRRATSNPQRKTRA